MKLIYAIVQDSESAAAKEALVKNGFSVTGMASTGGFLRFGNATLLIAAEPNLVPDAIALLDETCTPGEPGHHAATIFVVDMPVYRKTNPPPNS